MTIQIEGYSYAHPDEVTRSSIRRNELETLLRRRFRRRIRASSGPETEGHPIPAPPTEEVQRRTDGEAMVFRVI